MATSITSNANGSQQWSGLASSEVGDALPLPRQAPVMAVSARSGGGAGFNSDTVTMQGTVDGTNWFTLKEGIGGADVVFSADGYFEVSTGLAAIRPVAGAAVVNVDVSVRIG